MIDKDENVLVVCSPEDARHLLASNNAFADALVITSVVPVGELTIIPKEEFLIYLDKGLDDWKE